MSTAQQAYSKGRPPRATIKDDFGRSVTVDGSEEAFLPRGSVPPEQKAPILVLGSGPCPECAQNAVLSRFGTSGNTFLLESPRISEALRREAGGCRDAKGMTACSAEKAMELLPHAHILWHRQNLRLDSRFWGPFEGALTALELKFSPSALRGGTVQDFPQRTVLLPGGENRLLTRELTQAFLECGLEVRSLPERPDASAAVQALRTSENAFLFSVNMRGLDAEGRIFHLLRTCGIRCAVWFVDNPWHILSGISLPWWQEADLFVTDDSFVPELRQYGARHVCHLPLAAAQCMGKYRSEAAAEPESEYPPILFVGSSRFPDRERFFAAARIPETELAEALSGIARGERPDAAYWQKMLGEQLWPGYGARRVGLGAETCSAAARAAWVRAALPLGVELHGDEGWHALLPPQAKVLPPVDYYADLPALYNRAPITLNATSLLLPHGLTQRHFDVWAAGGFLLTDATPGLDIFPEELTREIRAACPDALAEHAARLLTDARRRTELKEAWQKEISVHHCYSHRIDTVLSALAKKSA